MPCRSSSPLACLPQAALALVATCAVGPVVLSAQPTNSFETSVPAAPFVDGDRVLFLGDSITHNGYYLYYIEHFYATRFPDRTITFRNAGISGGKAPDSERRLAWDVAAWRPTHVLINLGMNDVGTSHYTDATPEQRDATTEQMVVRYEDTMARILDALADMPTTVTVMVPTPYDQTGTHERLNAMGKNDAIRRLGGWLETETARRGVALVDLNTPLLEINARMQATNPSATAISPDRVHPGTPGHLVMATEILRAQGMGNATDEWLRLEVGADPTALQTATPTWLPWTLDDTAEGTLGHSALDALPWYGDRVAPLVSARIVAPGLPGGTWELIREGKVMGRGEAAGWAKGLDTSPQAASPWHVSSRALLAVLLEKREEERKLRGVAWVRSRVFDPRGTDVTDLAACDAAIAEWKAGDDYRPSNDRYVEEYLKYRDPATMAAIESRIAGLDARVAAWPAPASATIAWRPAVAGSSDAIKP